MILTKFNKKKLIKKDCKPNRTFWLSQYTYSSTKWHETQTFLLLHLIFLFISPMKPITNMSPQQNFTDWCISSMRFNYLCQMSNIAKQSKTSSPNPKKKLLSFFKSFSQELSRERRWNHKQIFNPMNSSFSHWT